MLRSHAFFIATVIARRGGKTVRPLFLVTVMALLCFLAACTPTNRMSREPDDIATRLDQLDEDIAELRANLQSPDEEVRTRAEERLSELLQQRDALYQDIQQLEASRAQLYEARRADLNRRFDELYGEATRARFNALETRDAFQTAFQARLHELEEEVQELERREQDMAQTEAAAYKKALSSIRGRLEALSQSYEELEQASEEDFRDLRRGLVEDLAALESEMRQTRRSP